MQAKVLRLSVVLIFIRFSAATWPDVSQNSSYKLIYFDWKKIVPNGLDCKINQTEILEYQRLLDTSFQEPIGVLFVKDVPKGFSYLGSWTHPHIIEHYTFYAKQMFRIFGDRVKKWITFYDPKKMCHNVVEGDFPGGLAEYLCVYNVLKAHGETFRIYDQQFRFFQKGAVSIALALNWIQPENSTDLVEIRAAERLRQFEFGLFANPILKFDYPELVLHRLEEMKVWQKFQKSRIPAFSVLEKKLLSGSCDFLWIILSKKVLFTQKIHHLDPETISLQTDHEVEIVREEYFDKYLATLLNWIKTSYNNPDIVLSEDDLQNLKDKKRRKNVIEAAHESGVSLKRYYV